MRRVLIAAPFHVERDASDSRREWKCALLQCLAIYRWWRAQVIRPSPERSIQCVSASATHARLK
jgi:hypothetical protein